MTAPKSYDDFVMLAVLCWADVASLKDYRATSWLTDIKQEYPGLRTWLKKEWKKPKIKQNLPELCTWSKKMEDAE